MGHEKNALPKNPNLPRINTDYAGQTFNRTFFELAIRIILFIRGEVCFVQAMAKRAKAAI
jgi:hypothetical protein